MDAHDKSLLDLVGHAVFAIEPDGRGRPVYAAYNQCARDVLGRTEDSILGLSAREVFPGRLGRIAYDHHAAALADGQPRAYEILLPIRGRNRRIQTSLKPQRDAHGRTIRLIGSFLDISSVQIFPEVQSGVDVISDEVQEFVHMAAHDLRAPIRQVELIANLLREDFTDLGDGKLDLIDLLEDISVRATSLITDVLSHAQATSSTAHETTFDFETLATEILALLDPMGRCDSIVGTGQVTGDRAAVLIILRNLVDNAIRHATGAEHKRPLRLVLSVASRADGFFRVSVRDNGAGFSNPAALFLAGGDLRASSGFGLLGVRRLINARGGSLTVRAADDGAGAEIAFALPGRVACAAEAATAAE